MKTRFTKSDVLVAIAKSGINFELISIGGTPRIRIPSGIAVAYRDWDHCMEIIDNTIKTVDQAAEAVTLAGLTQKERDAVVASMMEKKA